MSATSERGQALVELAIFGSLILLVMGLLISYGMNADFAQKASMDSFRRALGIASDPNEGAATVVMVNDRHIPSPGNTFGMGSMVPVSGSANVIRNHHMQDTADTEDELPKVTLNIQGTARTFKTAGMRDEAGIAGSKWDDKAKKYVNNNDAGRKADLIDKYEEIYGRGQVWFTGPATVKIIDSCDGEIIDYDSCVRQASQIVDPAICAKACERGRGPGSETGLASCADLCAPVMQEPWYVQGGQKSGNAYQFPALDAMFVGIRSMGLQPDSVKHDDRQLTLQKTETTSGVTTVDTGRWSQQVDRTIKTVQKSVGGRAINSEAVTTEKQAPSSRTWTVNW